MSALLTHRVEGDGPPVVLLNGGMMTIAAWHEVATSLVERFQVIRCDFRGQLLSPEKTSHGEPTTRLADHAADVVALLDHLDIDQAHVIGASFGGMIGVCLAADWPRRVTSLQAVTVGLRASERFDRSTRRVIEALDNDARGTVYDLVAEEVFSESYRRDHADVLASRRAATMALPDTWYGGLRRILETVLGFDLSAEAERVEAPSSVVVANLDEVMPPASSHQLATLLHAEVVEHPSAGHGLVMEDPRWLVETCLPFLERLTLERLGAS
ncbi:MAG: alpha/beta fold hydrolase [Acidobacteriota bacterium]